MKLKEVVASGCYLINAIYFLMAGLIFVFAKELLPFHLDVIQTPWSELDSASQTLFLGMMRTEGAGFLASSIAIFVLFWIPYRAKQAWAGAAMTVIGIVEHAPTFLANFHVAQTTAATPPWPIALTGMVLLIVGFVLSLSKTSD